MATDRSQAESVRPEKLVVDTDEAEAWARTLYGIEVEAEELPGEIDRNFLLCDSVGERWVLKVAPASSNRDYLGCQLAALDHLESSPLRRGVPHLVRDRNDEHSSLQKTRRGDEGWVRVVTYLPGRPLVHLECRPRALYEQIGSFLGRLDSALEDFDHPGAHRDFFWDVTRVLDLRPYLSWMDRPVSRLVEHHLDRFAKRVLPLVPELPKSIIHNDANDYNLLFDSEGGHLELRGIIDFGDMLHTVTCAEVAIACTYSMLGSEAPDRIAAEVIEGYSSTRALSDLERAAIPELILARLCNSLLMSAQAQHLAPDDPYLRISERPSIDLLERLTPLHQEPGPRTRSSPSAVAISAPT